MGTQSQGHHHHTCHLSSPSETLLDQSKTHHHHTCHMTTTAASKKSVDFHHDHYDPTDVNHDLLTSVLSSSRQQDQQQNDIWIFGFGSLVHTPGFEYEELRRGYIQGWKRVWWQGSTDHRGTPEFPGRTVTLTKHTMACYGVAYKLAGDAAQQRETLQYLEWREKQYDHREYVTVYAEPTCETVILDTALCYIATENTDTNPNYLGPAPMEDIAMQIAQSHGPSGPNSEYLFKIEAALKEHGAETSDEELIDLVRNIITRRQD